ncbi:hypothetical protein AA0242T_0844 [Acetobacter aceti NRIC 0242]|uniref:Uncharacterized protein n=2 Tax=Acetobacter aceti TaxID=435 RepID=A0A6S6PJR8_ACEAC|nr:hypothetical protein AAJCM20276_22070 [Acetobacter aceti]BCK74508.1 hypothetical protein EMQ_0114 [Acetobacter aceti NBRC 14818]GAN56017.1 hypothetical protein Abac_002_166 [Acetobacter aceti NBRC 14818]GBO80142.1 hypothetical protein AA0242T_0844 [Acetobacter aceti NRIC 0242]
MAVLVLKDAGLAAIGNDINDLSVEAVRHRMCSMIGTLLSESARHADKARRDSELGAKIEP